MFRKSVFIMLFVCLLASCQIASAYPWDNQREWNSDGVGDSQDWYDPNNWNPTTSIPWSDSRAVISPRNTSPMITGAANASMLGIHDWTYDSAHDDIKLIIADTATDVNFGAVLRIAADADGYHDGTLPPQGTLVVYGGTVTTPQPANADSLRGLIVGGSGSGFGTGYGMVNMYGGLVRVPRISLRNGIITLYGGTLEYAYVDPADPVVAVDPNFIFYQGIPGNKIDISGGTLKLKGDFTATADANQNPKLTDLIASRRIVSGHGTLGAPDYNITTQYTTLTSTDNNNLRAWNPSPYWNSLAIFESNVHYRVADVNVGITLGWNNGEPNVVAHRVYFGTSAALINAATTASAQYMGEVNEANGEPNNWHIDFAFKVDTFYYWRIDEVSLIDDVNTMVTKGLTWRFKTHAGKAYNPKPYSGSPYLSQPLQLRWTAGDFTQGTNGHRVFFGTASPLNATTTDYSYRGTQSGTVYNLKNLLPTTTITPGNTYYWQINEVNGTTTFIGDTWSFTAAPYIIVDDFEDYNSLADMNANWVIPYADCAPSDNLYSTTTFVRDSGGKHMRVHYDNAQGGFKYTETKHPYSPATSFTGGGVIVPALAALGVQHVGTALNGVNPDYDRMYVALQDTAGNVGVVLNEDGNAAAIATWTTWLVSLSDISAAGAPSPVNLQAVSGLSLGFGLRCNYIEPGTDGNVMFDNIRLYSSTCNPGFAYTTGGLTADLDSDCDVDINDLDRFAGDWLLQARTITDSNATAPSAPVLWYKFDDTGSSDPVLCADSGTGDANDYAGTINRYKPSNWDATSRGNAGNTGCLYLPSGGAPNWGNATYVRANGRALYSGHENNVISFSIWVKADLTAPEFSQWNSVIGVQILGDEKVENHLPTPFTPGGTASSNFTVKGRATAGYPNANAGTGQLNLSSFGGKWNHWAFVKGTNFMRSYLNGEQVAQIVDPNVETGDPNDGASGPLFIPDGNDMGLENTAGGTGGSIFILGIRAGNGWYNWGNWAGRIDDFQVYNYALDANEVKYLAFDGTTSIYVPLISSANLKTDDRPETEQVVNFADLAKMEDQWRTQVLWP